MSIVGASKQLGTIIEGESLLNDGAAIVLFNVFLVEMQPGDSQTSEKFNSHNILHNAAWFTCTQATNTCTEFHFQPIFIQSLINLHF